MKASFLQCENLIKIFQVGDLEVIALQGLNLEMAPGEMIALIGPSGAGKSTLLNVIGGLESPSAGGVQVGGWDLLRMKEHERVRYKRQVVGFVWQQPARNLLPYLSARENIELPMQHNKTPADQRKKRAMDLLDTVGLAERAHFYPDRLSGGEQQRAALAVALANNPPLLLGDEPTGQVDSESAMRVMRAVRAINQAYGTTVIIVTHDPLVAGQMDRVITLRDGRASREIHRRWDREESGAREEEWAILDPLGSVQLPPTYISSLEMRKLVRLHLEPDHVSVWPGPGGVFPLAQEAARPLDQGGDGAPAFGRFWEAGGRSGLPIIVDKLSRTFELAGERIHALQEVSWHVPAGSLSVIKGPSGSGKTTLLNLVAGLDEPSAGGVYLGEQSLSELSTQEKIDLCREQIGFVFQTFGLLPFLSVEENVQVPLRLLRTSRQERQILVANVLALVGLADRTHHRTYELSGGEQQRVAIARALVKHPSLILADEPTGQLDSLTGASIIALLKRIAAETGVTVVIASHDPNVHQAADQILELKDGRRVEPALGAGHPDTIDPERRQANAQP